MEQPNRQYAHNEAYRFGFNGKENDREWGTASLTQDYGFRLYNPAIAKFLSVDPLAPEYPFLSTYQFASDNPITNIDIDGLEGGQGQAYSGTQGNQAGRQGTISQNSGQRALQKAAEQGAASKARTQIAKEGSKKVAGRVIMGRVFGVASLMMGDLGTADVHPNNGFPQHNAFSDEQIEEILDNNIPSVNNNFKLPKEESFWWRTLREDGGVNNREELFQITPVPEAKNFVTDKDGMITLYRGVGVTHDMFEAAKNGWAIPLGWGKIGSHRNPYYHNAMNGDNVSIFTSWTIDEKRAKYFAGLGGVILTKKIKAPNFASKINYVQPSPDMMNENEVLLIGPIKADKVEKNP